MTLGSSRALLAVLLLAGAAAAVPAQSQVPRAPSGGPTGQFLGPPTGSSQDLLGAWAFTWDGPPDDNCPCRGTITIQFNDNADGGGFDGSWEMKGATAVLHGSVGYNQNTWDGKFTQPDDGSGFPVTGRFRIAVVDPQTLTGSYQRDGMTIAFSWRGTRK
jgi:hypothetical protein